jgi:cell volume regulation protein A
VFLIDFVTLTTGVLLLLGIVSSKLSARLGVPVLVLFLLLGMLAGSEGLGGLEFENYKLAHAIGTLALAMILFDGGLSTSLSAIRVAWKPAALLATWGVLLTAVITGVAAAWILQIELLQGLLLGSIVGSTDAAAVFAVLRSGGVSLPKRIAAVLEVESASNDPMAIFLTVGCIEVLLGNVTIGPPLLGLFASQMLIGCLCGVLGGYAAGWVANRIELGAAGMYPVLITAFGLLTYGLAAEFGGSGFLAIYLAGVIVGNRPLVFQRGIRLFHDALAWLSQIVMFVVLGLLSFPSRFVDVAGKALLISAVLILVARPIAVLLSVFPFRFTRKELVFISWVGLKGAVPITLATFPLMLATPERSLQAPLLFDVVFFIVVVSAVVQGTSLTPMARWLGLERPRDPEPPVTLEISSLRHVNGEVVDYSVGDDSRAAGRMVKDLALPEGAVIALIARGEQIVPPQGNTCINAGDHVILVLRPGILPLVNQVFGRNSDVRGMIPNTLEFPLRASTTVGDIQELYAIQIDAPSERTLAEVMSHELGNWNPSVGEGVTFGPLMFRILRLSGDGQIEMVGMSLLPEKEEGVAVHQQSAAPSDSNSQTIAAPAGLAKYVKGAKQAAIRLLSRIASH